MKPSFNTQLTKLLIELTGAKKVFADTKRAKFYIAKKAVENEKKVFPPFFLLKKAERRNCKDMDFFFIKGKRNVFVFYFHGGAFVAQPNFAHWLFLDMLSKKTKANIILPIYPKAPIHTHKETYPILFELYEEIRKNNKDAKFVFMGDSAGGNIALSFALQLKQKRMLLPHSLILFSPCLDLTLNIKEAEDIDMSGNDSMLSIPGLKMMYECWAGNQKLENKILSPINADLYGLPKTTIFVGTYEILYPETLEFEKRAHKQNMPLTLVVGEKMGHVYPYFLSVEGKKARKQVFDLITQKD